MSDMTPIPAAPGAGPPSNAAGDYLKPAFWAGICAGVLSGVPLLSAGCCLWMAGGGTLAVYFFQLQNSFPLRRPGDGARLGMLAGFFGFLVASIVNVSSQLLLFRGWEKFTTVLRRQLEQTLPKDPQGKEALAWAMTTDGLITMIVLGALMFLTLFVLLSMAGGADRKSTRLNSSHIQKSRMPSSA